MRATELQRALDEIQIPQDEQVQEIICRVLQALRKVLRRNVMSGPVGLGGRIFKLFYPKTAAGLLEVVELLDEYLEQHCGA